MANQLPSKPPCAPHSIGEHGDLDIHAIDLNIRETNIHAVGSIKGEPKLTNFDIVVDRGRAEDVMQPFVHDDVPITGPVWLQSHAYVGPPGDGFMERLRMTGTLNVPAEKIADQRRRRTCRPSASAPGEIASRTPAWTQTPVRRMRQKMCCRLCRAQQGSKTASYPLRGSLSRSPEHKQRWQAPFGFMAKWRISLAI